MATPGLPSRLRAAGRLVSALLLVALVVGSSFNFFSVRASAWVITVGGFHESANCSLISGWAWDSAQPNTPISVDIYSDGNLVMTVLADQFRQDLVNTGVGNGSHGFTFTVPMSLKDGQPHSISVKFAGTSTDLSGTPKSITCP